MKSETIARMAGNIAAGMIGPYMHRSPVYGEPPMLGCAIPSIGDLEEVAAASVKLAMIIAAQVEGVPAPAPEPLPNRMPVNARTREAMVPVAEWRSTHECASHCEICAPQELRLEGCRCEVHR